jgi:hypothetical protein
LNPALAIVLAFLRGRTGPCGIGLGIPLPFPFLVWTPSSHVAKDTTAVAEPEVRIRVQVTDYQTQKRRLRVCKLPVGAVWL